ncbi:trypsin-like serine peptidase [Primorskyibacter sp. 2E233]|uniref:trypsin-like serine peptidase n=1 Tax=Primorskyibacter sp. 2E233 TaxID=3413431 RepID=UPI003BF060A7
MRAVCLYLLVWGAAAHAQDIPVLESRIDGGVRDLDLRIGPEERSDDLPVVWKDGIEIPDTDYLRLLIQVEGPQVPETAQLYLFSELDQEFIIPLIEVPEDGYWTGLIPNGQVTMALFTPDRLSDETTVRISNLSVQQDEVVLYSTHGENQLYPIAAPEVPDEIRALSGPVAFLSFFDGGVPRTCTGFLVAPDLLLTNEHCIRSDESCATMTAVFGYRRNEVGGLSMGPQLRCKGYAPEQSSFAYDVTAVHLSASPGEAFGTVTVPQDPVQPEGPLVIIQHPGDLPMEVSFIDCAAVQSPVTGRAPDSDFTHTCDTASGSSGAPILNLSGQLVGIHHFGFQEAPESAWKENRGVLAAPITAWLTETMGPF